MKPIPELRQRIRVLMEDQWREPVSVIYLDTVRPTFEVPGRRKDGTVKGKRLIRRLLRNIIRVVIGVPIDIVLSINAGAPASLFQREGRVVGPANAQALGLVDAAMAAGNPWLVHSPSHVAVVDSGPRFDHDEAPVVRWHATKPDMPKIAPIGRRVTWPDGSCLDMPYWQNDDLRR